MTDVGYAALNTTVDRTNEVLRQIETAYGWTKERRNQSYAALRVVLHALRDRLTVEESAHFAAQLPVLVKGIYFDGWDPSAIPAKLDREEFLQRVRREFRYEIEGNIEGLVSTVLQALDRYVTAGEWEDIRSMMPKGLASVIP